jgi:hypothetical protein
LLATPFLDIQSSVRSTGGEQGLLALAFDPSYETNGRFYIAYTAPRNGDSVGSVLILKQYSVSAGNPDLANAASGTTILSIDHPTYGNHNGGTLAFGSDGYLYWSTGDGGSGGDPNNNAQNLNTLLGKILRIDVSAGSSYTIPTTNPFFGNPSTSIKKEIWSYGLRNPWRISFDRITHELYIGDVGQSAREEVDFQPATSAGGENYGWRIMEGTLCYNPPSGCNPSGKVLPIAEYDHSLGCSITGGHVYRGSSYPSLQGYYLYGDFCSGRLFAIYKNTPTGWSGPVQLVDTSFGISSFGEDESGELYLADYSTGRIYQIQYDEPYRIISGNAGVQDVNLNYEDGVPRTAISQADGSYSIQVLPGWTGTVTPEHACYTFSPSNRPYSNVQQNIGDQNYTPTFNPAAGCANVQVTIAGNLTGGSAVPPRASKRQVYGNINAGPAQVASSNGVPIITSERVLAVGKSHSEMMGYPNDRLTKDYVFPFYNNVDFDGQLRVSNVGGADTTITVYLGSDPNPMDSFPLGAGQAVRINYGGMRDGPMRVVSSASNILTTIRSWVGGVSYSELMGYPSSQLTNEYIFPFYNNIDFDSQLRVSNVGGVDTTITVYLGNDPMPIDSFPLMAGEASRNNYPLRNGPLRVVSSDSNILTTIRALVGGVSYSELMGYPANQPAKEYWYPVYDNLSLDSQLRVSNIGMGTTTISVYLGNTLIDSFDLEAGAASRTNYPRNTGPLHVVSSAEPILTTIRLYKVTDGVPSYYELVGFPDNQLTTRYWFPRYNSIDINTEMRFAVP